MAERQPLVTDSIDQAEGSPARLSGQDLPPNADTPEPPKPAHSSPSVVHGANKATSSTSGLSSWIPEIVSYHISLLSLFAIIAVVRLRDGKPLPDWPGFLTINFLVSAFSSILKAALLMPVAEVLSELKWLWFAKPQLVKDIQDFDLASRGPRGSLRFLFQHPRNLFACLGAFIIVASLGIDSLTQLTVQPYDCLRAIPGVAFVNKTSNYTAAGEIISTFLKFIDIPMSRAIYQGILSSEADNSDIFYYCLSGNCTFRDTTFYRSLAMCYSVVNISAEITGDMDYSLPSGLNTTYHGYEFSTAEAPQFTDDPEEVPLFAFEALDYGNFAFRASIYPCMQTFRNLIISETQLTQELESETRLPRINISIPYFSLAGDFPPLPGIDCTPSTSSQGRKTRATRTLKSGRQYVLPVEDGSQYADPDEDLQFARGPNISFYDPACTYTFGIQPTYAIPEYFRFLYGTPGHQNSVTGTWSAIGDILLMYLYNNGRPNMSIAEAYMKRLANAMTIQMRRNGDATNSAPILGQPLGDKTCVRFEWMFLLLDIILLTGTAGFILVTVWISWRHSRRTGRRPWKSSSLPLLWCGLEDTTRRRFARMGHVEKELWENSDVLEVMLTRVQDAEELQPLQERDTEMPAAGQQEEGDIEIPAAEQPGERSTGMLAAGQQEEDDTEMPAAEQQEVDQSEGADLIEEIVILEKGRSLELGSWVLRAEREIMVPRKYNLLRRAAFWLSDYLPI